MEVLQANYATLNGERTTEMKSGPNYQRTGLVQGRRTIFHDPKSGFYLALLCRTSFIADLYISNIGSRSYFLFITLYKEG